MHRGYSSVRDMVKTCPLPLLRLKDKALIDYANSLFPTSVGIEIETLISDQNLSFLIPDLLVNQGILSCDYSRLENELKVRLTSGIQGLIGLYEVSTLLKKYANFNKASGIHYHIDISCNSNKSLIQDLFYSSQGEEIKRKTLSRLISWNYTGTYNSPRISEVKQSWIRIHPCYTTLEFRIGEMTFDYTRLVKRITEAQKITKFLLHKALKNK